MRDGEDYKDHDAKLLEQGIFFGKQHRFRASLVNGIVRVTDAEERISASDDRAAVVFEEDAANVPSIAHLLAEFVHIAPGEFYEMDNIEYSQRPEDVRGW